MKAKIWLSALSVLASLAVAQADTPAPDLSKGMEGHWKTNCSVADNFGQSQTDDFVTQDNSGQQTTTYYSDSNCTQPVIKIEWVYAQTVGADVRTNVKMLDLSYSAVSATALNDAGRIVLETYGYCGLTSWPVNSKQDLTARSGGAHCTTKVPFVVYTVFSIVGDKLYFGTFTRERSARSSELNTDWFLVRGPGSFEGRSREIQP